MTWTGWVNGFPNLADAITTLDFAKASKLDNNSTIASKAVIFGNGNVALDVARLLLMPIETLKHTDIKENALKTLASSSIKHVNIVGRRGPGQVSFTTAELREIFKLATEHRYTIFTNRLDLIENLPTTFSHGEPRTLQSVVKLFKKTSIQQLDDWNVDISKEYGCEKSLTLTFMTSPVSFHGNDENGMATAIECHQNDYISSQEGSLNEQKVIQTDRKMTLKASLFVKCIGFMIGPVPSLPPALQDPKTGRIIADRSVLKENFPDYKNLFTSGWCKKGPAGQLASTMYCAYETAQLIVDYLAQNPKDLLNAPGRTWLLEHLKLQGTKYLLFKDWQKIDDKEIELGKSLNKPREKLTDTDSIAPFKHF